MEWDFLIDRSQDGSRGGGMVERTGQSSRGGSCAWLSLAVWTFGGSPVYRAKKQPLFLLGLSLRFGGHALDDAANHRLEEEGRV